MCGPKQMGQSSERKRKGSLILKWGVGKGALGNVDGAVGEGNSAAACVCVAGSGSGLTAQGARGWGSGGMSG